MCYANQFASAPCCSTNEYSIASKKFWLRRESSFFLSSRRASWLRTPDPTFQDATKTRSRPNGTTHLLEVLVGVFNVCGGLCQEWVRLFRRKPDNPDISPCLRASRRIVSDWFWDRLFGSRLSYPAIVWWLTMPEQEQLPRHRLKLSVSSFDMLGVDTLSRTRKKLPRHNTNILVGLGRFITAPIPTFVWTPIRYFNRGWSMFVLERSHFMHLKPSLAESRSHSLNGIGWTIWTFPALHLCLKTALPENPMT